MRTKTDIEGMKRVAKLLLDMPIEIDKHFEFICIYKIYGCTKRSR